MTRVLVADDSRCLRTVIGNALAESGYDVETIETDEAAGALAEFDPDVVTVNGESSDTGEHATVEAIMATDPTPVLVLGPRSDALLDAFGGTVVDFVSKPDETGSRNIAHVVEEVLESVESLAETDVSALAVARTASAVQSVTAARTGQATTAGTTPASSSGVATPTEPSPVESAPNETERRSSQRRGVADSSGRTEPTIVLGASTGGPDVVERLFDQLPASLDARVLVVQHMPTEFTARFADRLDGVSEYTVREAREGERLAAGEAVVAPGGSHLEITTTATGRMRLRLDDREPVHGVRPSIDVTMQSAAEQVEGPLGGVVLTGMGRDGAAGIEAIDDVGGYTIAQDEPTSSVFGIPCQAIRTGCVDAVLPAGEIVDELVGTFAGENDD
ncbi:chemotaxis protein CheB [Natrialbaceae archaeon A-arb3/5]